MAKNDDRNGERWELDWEDLPFKGEIEFEISFKLFRKTVKRQAKVVFAHAPEDEFYDVRTKKVRKSILSTRWHVMLLTVPSERARPKHKARWVEMSDLVEMDVLPDDVIDRIQDAIEARGRAMDRERRKAAGLK